MQHVHIISDTRTVEINAAIFPAALLGYAKNEVSAYAGQMHTQPETAKFLSHVGFLGTIYKLETSRNGENITCEVTPMPKDNPIYDKWLGL